MLLFCRNKRGFTLIELLVVMTIVSILMAISFVGFIGTRAGTRDTKRKADLEQIRSALETYRSDYGGYPSSFTPSAGLTCGVAPVITYLNSTNDPLTGYSYKYVPGSTTTNGCTGPGTGITSYTICAKLEVTPTISQCTTQSCGGGNCNFQAISP